MAGGRTVGWTVTAVVAAYRSLSSLCSLFEVCAINGRRPKICSGCVLRNGSGGQHLPAPGRTRRTLLIELENVIFSGAQVERMIERNASVIRGMCSSVIGVWECRNNCRIKWLSDLQCLLNARFVLNGFNFHLFSVEFLRYVS